MSEIFQKKVAETKRFFAHFSSPEERYHALIEMGRKIPSFPSDLKTVENLVSGCQSNLYLQAELIEGKVFFLAASDALISAGLAALLISVYEGESPETILTEPPEFLTELGLHILLSPNRSNGLTHIHLAMKRLALRFLIRPVS